MLALNTIFENGQLEVDYSYAEDIDDGRGITFGRCGFCTGTGDGLVVVAESSASPRATCSPSTSSHCA